MYRSTRIQSVAGCNQRATRASTVFEAGGRRRIDRSIDRSIERDVRESLRFLNGTEKEEEIHRLELPIAKTSDRLRARRTATYCFSLLPVCCSSFFSSCLQVSAEYSTTPYIHGIEPVFRMMTQRYCLRHPSIVTTASTTTSYCTTKTHPKEEEMEPQQKKQRVDKWIQITSSTQEELEEDSHRCPPHHHPYPVNHVVVTEESSLSDHSHSYPSSSLSIIARRKMNKKKSNRSNMQFELRGLKTTTSTTKNNEIQSKRIRKATQFYLPFEKIPVVTATFPPPIQQHEQQKVRVCGRLRVRPTTTTTTRKTVVRKMGSNRKHPKKSTNQNVIQIRTSKKRPFSTLYDNDDMDNTLQKNKNHTINNYHEDADQNNQANKEEEEELPIAARVHGRHSRRIVTTTNNTTNSMYHNHTSTIDASVTNPSHKDENSQISFQLPYETLLEEYQQKVVEGTYETVRFGPTIESAMKAIETQLAYLKEQKQKYPSRYRDFVEDVEVVADLRDYKKSLRSFSIHEAQEKLALEKERQEYERLAFQQQRKKMTDMQLEWLQLAERKIVFRNAMMHLSTRKNKCPMSIPEQCTLCCRYAVPENVQNTTSSRAATTISYDAPIPRIRHIETMDEDDKCHDDEHDPNHEKNRNKRNWKKSESSSSKKNKNKNVTTRLEEQRKRFQATEIALMQLFHSLEFIITHQTTALQFSGGVCGGDPSP